MIVYQPIIAKLRLVSCPKLSEFVYFCFLKLTQTFG